MVALGLLSSGETATVIEVRGTPNDPHPKTQQRVSSMGLREGQSVEMLSNGRHGPLLVKVDNARIAIARRIAHKNYC